MHPALAAALLMTAIVAVRYVAISGGFAWLTARLHPGLYAGTRMARQMRREIGWSLSAAAIYGLPAGLVMWLWLDHGMTRIYTDVAAHHWLWLPASVAIYLFAHDTWFYWTHRAMHRPALFRRMHAVHHDSRPPTAWAAMSFHPWESLSGALLVPALVFLVPIHVVALGVVLAVMSFFGVTNHLGWELFPRRWLAGRFGEVMITASHHHKHHTDYRSNFGLYFRFWDRLCKTDRGLSGDMLHARDADRGTGGADADRRRAAA
jgi:sterol desaturase/sphingolipid hydroxylase (fatty acid hydroxylase superfamily)